MIQQVAEVLGYRRIGDDYHSVTIVAPDIAAVAKPGQFVNLRPPADRSFILRRPYSIYRVGQRGSGGAPSTIEVIFDITGPGSRALSALRPHDPIDIVGPSGRGFTLPKTQFSCMLVGGGIGAVPLFFLADALTAGQKRVDIVWGAATEARLLSPIEAKRLGATAEFATEDGSVGHQGLVTDLLAEQIQRCSTEVIYACGPHGMLAAVTKIGLDHQIPVQVAVEELMGCGLGVCMTCVTPIWTKDGSDVVYARTCVEGPVFNGARVLWDGHPKEEVAAPEGN